MLRREDVGGTERMGDGSLFEGTWTKRSHSREVGRMEAGKGRESEIGR